MGLNDQRVAPASDVWDGFIEPSFPLSSLLVHPAVHSRLPHFDVLELGIRIPKRSRFAFIGGNEQRRLVETLFHCDLKPVLRNAGIVLDLFDNLPPAIGGSPVLVVSARLVRVNEANVNLLVIGLNKMYVVDIVIAFLSMDFGMSIDELLSAEPQSLHTLGIP